MAQLPWHGPLFPVSKYLAERYALALKHARNLSCPLDTFSVDRMGWSPQLAAVLGENYLGDSSLRYAIILSPDQASAPPVRRRFSYEAALIEQVYIAARPTLLSLVADEPVVVEMDNGMTFCRSASDVLGIRGVTARVDTPRGTLDKTRDLLQLSHGFSEQARILDDSYIEQMLALSKEIGDPRKRVLPPGMHQQIGSLWAEVAGVVYVLRAADNRTLVIATKLDGSMQAAQLTALEIDSQAVVDALHAHGFLRYVNVDALVQRRLREMEIDALLHADETPANDDVARRRQLNGSASAQRALSSLYWELDREQKQRAAGSPFDPQRMSIMARWALSTPTQDADVVGNLQARFVRYDYRLLAHHHRRIINAEWDNYSEAKKRYLTTLFPYMQEGFIR
ncbi:MAG TPA: DUF6638 family protein [Roseiflexaceae bacterium]|jgi:hypothetical protein|nr:DUF6638 family protein [Roseiflexaceae bacterium]